MPFIHSLKKESKEAEVGKLYVSVKGGNTANTEFEFLTGNSMGFLPARKACPYQQYIKQEQLSLASHLRGSRLCDQRPSSPCSGLVQNKVYPWLGFDNTYFQNDFENATKLGLCR